MEIICDIIYLKYFASTFSHHILQLKANIKTFFSCDVWLLKWSFWKNWLKHKTRFFNCYRFWSSTTSHCTSGMCEGAQDPYVWVFVNCPNSPNRGGGGCIRDLPSPQYRPNQTHCTAGEGLLTWRHLFYSHNLSYHSVWGQCPGMHGVLNCITTTLTEQETRSERLCLDVASGLPLENPLGDLQSSP